MEYIVNIFEDKDAGVWVATSEEVPGLVLELDCVDTLIQQIKLTVPELLSLNKGTSQKSISLCVIIRCEL